jgi:hypothetical protein
MEFLGDHTAQDEVFASKHVSRARFDTWLSEARIPFVRKTSRPLPSDSLSEHVFCHPSFKDHTELEKRILPVLKSLQRPHLAKRVLMQVAAAWPAIPSTSDPRLPFKIWKAAAAQLGDHLPEEFRTYTGLCLNDTGDLDMLHTTPVLSQIDDVPFSFCTLLDLRSVWVTDNDLVIIRQRLGRSIRALMIGTGSITEVCI